MTHTATREAEVDPPAPTTGRCRLRRRAERKQACESAPDGGGRAPSGQPGGSRLAHRAKARRARSLKGGDGLACRAIRRRTGANNPTAPPARGGVVSPSASRSPLPCPAPILRGSSCLKTPSGWRAVRRVACPRAAGASFCTCPRRWWSAARRCARRVHDPRKIVRRAIYTRCRALRRSISPRLPGGQREDRRRAGGRGHGKAVRAARNL